MTASRALLAARARIVNLAGSRLARQSIGRIGARIVASGLQALTLLLLARHLGATSFGLFAVGIAVGYLASAVASLGGPYRVLRAAAEENALSLRATLLLVLIAGSVILSAAATLLWGIGLLEFAGLAGFLLGVSDQVNTFGQFDAAGSGAHGSASSMAIQQRAIPAAVVLLTAGAFSLPLMVASFGFAAIYPLVHGLRATPLRLARKRTLRGSWGFWSYTLMQTSPQLEAPVVNAVADATTAGLYGIANRVANPLTILSSALGSIFIPEIAAATSEGRRRSLGARLIAVSTAYAVVISALAVWIAPLVVELTGPAYRSAEPLIAATVVAAGLSSISQAYNALLIAAGRPFASTLTLGIGTATSLAGLAALASFDGARMLWVAPLLTQAVVLIIFVAFSRADRASAARRRFSPAAAPSRNI